MFHKGFSGILRFLARSNLRFGGQETTPQSLTAHTLDRCIQALNTTNECIPLS